MFLGVRVPFRSKGLNTDITSGWRNWANRGRGSTLREKFGYTLGGWRAWSPGGDSGRYPETKDLHRKDGGEEPEFISVRVEPAAQGEFAAAT